MTSLALLIVGDEILSGKRQDRHLSKVRELLHARGIELAEVRIVGDDEERIAQAVAQLHARGDVVLSCGGIGATPDDRTRQAVARAFNVPLVRHAEGEALIVNEYAEKAFPNRVLMADFPAGAALIPNPVNRVAGFSLNEVYCVPGFPEMAWPMLEWVLDTRLRHLHRAAPPVEYSLRATGTSSEGDLLDLMEQVLRDFPGVSLSSLPSRGDASRARHIEFGIKGSAEIAAPAFTWFRQHLQNDYGVQIEDLRIPP
ncbi:MAG: Molybdenum cofactor synthesis protein [Hydrocarboniphaga sp.]|uniref:competence/damage-inducible protein A n=1 Tax=Hydrocarboniphaga sp. TaxID=2033016 RepID=UPI00262AD696|nr:molybdopterin-binding protein [Hydrocarboniphaga sp.]MDB5969006.1 Molybdenum cofactor synthesis protein [Hydrocarboniphaga sp.]